MQLKGPQDLFHGNQIPPLIGCPIRWNKRPKNKWPEYRRIFSFRRKKSEISGASIKPLGRIIEFPLLARSNIKELIASRRDENDPPIYLEDRSTMNLVFRSGYNAIWIDQKPRGRTPRFENASGGKNSITNKRQR